MQHVMEPLHVVQVEDTIALNAGKVVPQLRLTLPDQFMAINSKTKIAIVYLVEAMANYLVGQFILTLITMASSIKGRSYSLTDDQGRYYFEGLSYGTYNVRELLKPEYIPTTPDAGHSSVILSNDNPEPS